MTETVAVVDYGMGNLHSAGKALEKMAADGQRIVITGDPDVVRGADRVVFPGVGAIRDCIRVITETGLDRAILDAIDAYKPVLGICVGMQAMMDFSEENDGVDCLGVFSGRVQFFGEQFGETGQRLKVPHMGWNQVQQTVDHPVWDGIDDNSRFYFVHSYCATGLPEEELAGRCEYGLTFAAAVAKHNVFAVQFHPEKSADAGLRLLANFLRWQP
ncbi:imidazole glycerol phosphate synthase subunit HisH [Alloalcanivorax profundimaris]|jgi:imidazole glycerol-phosphate synthase subunit HisH|uniref:Imidazole glycerol phosphate synthase subunit HisH n=1 Tax=Alloalcanivorax profundimaris TaxID=2735259 RepID=A0ABS0AP91_9GAMM|nr:imidazole glycerol phosphate synthase subunit HisH [Alloalcanivorax profundimaris]MAO60226.1 imidazole glycerol phosphate synthase subunit HisH [Alcanivorax sp.]MCQ6263453.1 imidazole glycerol phosphate synthase subunit HisH [Alcanivorax sp. MM125-6]UWN49553.1 Imidazole glycerol phosphate synthase subunit HisH 1 [Alcanivorax sp. ALC70]MBF1801703.1 imidazole glycerol phosphate synthase subunit HisH [Alloalcanivorax profundimaris]MBF5055947.1 glutamine amidotransferase subunit hisH [Alloalcan|tara:strand:- start:1333 stop:1977 length:645 start_codon:yes stop_codon:yes gene_type:complete